MNNEQMLQQTAAAFEDHLIRVRDYASAPLDDLKTLATWYDDVTPGEMVMLDLVLWSARDQAKK